MLYASLPASVTVVSASGQPVVIDAYGKVSDKPLVVDLRGLRGPKRKRVYISTMKLVEGGVLKLVEGTLAPVAEVDCEPEPERPAMETKVVEAVKETEEEYVVDEAEDAEPEPEKPVEAPPKFALF
jgi:hypothetical protein